MDKRLYEYICEALGLDPLRIKSINIYMGPKGTKLYMTYQVSIYDEQTMGRVFEEVLTEYALVLKEDSDG